MCAGVVVELSNLPQSAQLVARALCDEKSESALIVGLLVAAAEAGSVCIDLADLDSLAVGLAADSGEEYEATGLPGAEAAITALRADGLVGEQGDSYPLALRGTLLYLHRYATYEDEVARQFSLRAAAAPLKVDETALAAALAGPLPGLESPDPDQLRALQSVCRNRDTIICGGPGTGKTTLISAILSVLCSLPDAPKRVLLAAPTGKAAARLAEAVAESAEPAWANLVEPPGSLHRVLGLSGDAPATARFNESNRLPHDLVIVDEMSMVSLGIMSALLRAIRPNARLVLLGDPDQLASITPGVVLADISAQEADRNVVTLSKTHRFGGQLAAFAAAVRDGNAPLALDIMEQPASCGVIELRDPEQHLDELYEGLRDSATTLRHAAESGDAAAALAEVNEHRLLCAHRAGPLGATAWQAVATRLSGLVPTAAEPWPPGTPVMVLKNDYTVSLFNGDVGVAVATPDGTRIAFPGVTGIRYFHPAAVASATSVFAMTVHKSQGSQFSNVSIMLPHQDSMLLTRNTLYTAVTRAKESVMCYGSPDQLRAAIERVDPRGSGLRERLGGRT